MEDIAHKNDSVVESFETLAKRLDAHQRSYRLILIILKRAWCLALTR